MKIEYGRNAQSSFMRIPMEGEIQKTDEEMLGRNKIEGLLEVAWQKEDRGYVLRYNITGKQALDAVLENSMADERLLLSLIQEICSLCRRIEKFLLSQQGVVLEPETIFWDSREEKFYFCYFPSEYREFQSKFIHLMEYLLTKTDHKNKKAVDLVYGVYETLMQVGDNINEIQRHIEIIRKLWKEEEYSDEEKNIIDIEEVTTKEGKKLQLKKVVIKETIWERIKKKLQIWIRPEWQKVIKQKKKEEFVFEPEEEPEKLTTPTILLSAEKCETKGILKYEGESALKDIYISQIPFLIGSEEGCDGLIDDVTVSRKHAIITKVEEIYFIEDMNSSNGTRVDGEYIGYKTKISLKRNDIIHFSNQRYRFI